MVEVVNQTAKDYSHDLRIPTPVKTRTVAPTGTIAKMPGVSEGIHPIFAKYFLRRIRFSNVDERQRKTVEDYKAQGYNTAPCLYAPETTVVEIPTQDILMANVIERYGEELANVFVETAEDVSLEDMLAFQAMYQEFWADNAVSYTVNVDAKKYSADDIGWALKKHYHVLKGATIFPEMSMAQSPYERISKADYAIYVMSDSIDENCVNGCPIK